MPLEKNNQGQNLPVLLWVESFFFFFSSIKKSHTRALNLEENQAMFFPAPKESDHNNNIAS